MGKTVRKWLALFLGLMAAFFLLSAVEKNYIVKADELAFGTDTANILGDVDGLTTHCLGAKDSADCETAYNATGRLPAILWVGNSQLPAINRMQPGQENAPQLLFRRLKPRGKYLVTYSQPNANLSEHAVLLQSISTTYKPDLVILPVVFDDIREQGVRPLIADFADDAAIYSRLKESKTWPFIKSSFERADGNADGQANLGLDHENFQKISERHITGWLERHWGLWASRQRLRGTLTSATHILRNKALGIHSYSKRSVNPQIYQERMTLLSIMVEELKTSGAQVLLYVPPYRNDIDGPYVKAQYAQFKADFEAIAGQYGAEFLDLEHTVPGPEWATVTDRIFGFKEPDFMHFTAEGHQRFSEALDVKLQEMGY